MTRIVQEDVGFSARILRRACAPLRDKNRGDDGFTVAYSARATVSHAFLCSLVGMLRYFNNRDKLMTFPCGGSRGTLIQTSEMIFQRDGISISRTTHREILINGTNVNDASFIISLPCTPLYPLDLVNAIEEFGIVEGSTVSARQLLMQIQKILIFQCFRKVHKFREHLFRAGRTGLDNEAVPREATQY